MAIKDLITLSISVAAFIVSLMATTITLRQKKYDVQRLLRQQITDVVGKLITIATEREKLVHEYEKNEYAPYAIAMDRMLNHQNNSFARQALYLINQVPSLVSDVEYLTVSDALNLLGDVAQAEEYKIKAIEASPSRFYKSLNQRSYARFLFFEGRYDEGRKYYEASLQSFSDTTNAARWIQAQTFMLWAEAEAEANLLNNAEELYKRARLTAKQISNKVPRTRSLGIINTSEKVALKISEKTDNEKQPSPAEDSLEY